MSNNPVLLAEAAPTALIVGDSTRARNYISHGLTLYPHYGSLQWQWAACALAEDCPAQRSAWGVFNPRAPPDLTW